MDGLQFPEFPSTIFIVWSLKSQLDGSLILPQGWRPNTIKMQVKKKEGGGGTAAILTLFDCIPHRCPLKLGWAIRASVFVCSPWNPKPPQPLQISKMASTNLKQEPLIGSAWQKHRKCPPRRPRQKMPRIASCLLCISWTPRPSHRLPTQPCCSLWGAHGRAGGG